MPVLPRSPLFGGRSRGRPETQFLNSYPRSPDFVAPNPVSEAVPSLFLVSYELHPDDLYINYLIIPLTFRI
ncbi:MAG: hypothetical protein GDA43_17350 [Hormoscilla sp. SP5CHS1]|nr:hypothetical protein [Hormoscilla sp. SP5CHS1]